jgi:hypothetical protein
MKLFDLPAYESPVRGKPKLSADDYTNAAEFQIFMLQSAKLRAVIGTARDNSRNLASVSDC